MNWETKWTGKMWLAQQSVQPQHITYIGKDILGATCTWDLHYWLATEFELHQQGAQYRESEAEEIMGIVWVSLAEAVKLALDPKQFSESRSALKILQLEKNL